MRGTGIEVLGKGTCAGGQRGRSAFRPPSVEVSRHLRELGSRAGRTIGYRVRVAVFDPRRCGSSQPSAAIVRGESWRLPDKAVSFVELQEVADGWCILRSRLHVARVVDHHEEMGGSRQRRQARVLGEIAREERLKGISGEGWRSVFNERIAGHSGRSGWHRTLLATREVWHHIVVPQSTMVRVYSRQMLT